MSSQPRPTLKSLSRLQFRGRGLLTSSAILFASMTLVNVGNYAFNLVLGRWLGPAAFADVSLIVTLMLLASFITAALTQTTARFTAIYSAQGETARVASLRRWVRRGAWGVGVALMALLALGAPAWQAFFNTLSPWPFVIFAIGIPIFLAQSVDRGVLQGELRFGKLAASFQAEMWVRLIAAVALVALGLSVNGAVAALTLSFVATWLVVRAGMKHLPPASPMEASERRAVGGFAIPVLIALIGQVLINNSDVLIVKHFFDPAEAGQYAALALVGRIVFFATWSVVTVMFSIVAQRHERGERHRHLLGLSLLMVTLVSAGLALLMFAAPETVVQWLFGSAYLGIAPLLWLYAVATGLYALANVVVNYRLSIGFRLGSYVVALAGLAQIVGLWLVHSSLFHVVMVQLAIMAALCVILLLWEVGLGRSAYLPPPPQPILTSESR